MRHILAAAAIGAGIALIAFALDWLLDHLDEVDEPEPLWPASKPFSRTITEWGAVTADYNPRSWPVDAE